MHVRCTSRCHEARDEDGSTYTITSDLTPGKLYRVISIEYGDYRLLGDEGDPYLYPAVCFAPVDQPPVTWVQETVTDGMVWQGPAELRKHRCLFDRYFDRQPDAVEIVESWLKANGFRPR